MNSYSKILIQTSDKFKIEKNTHNEGAYWSIKEHNFGNRVFGIFEINFEYDKASLLFKSFWKIYESKLCPLLNVKAAQLDRNLFELFVITGTNVLVDIKHRPRMTTAQFVFEKIDDLWEHCTTESLARSLAITFQGQLLILCVKAEKTQWMDPVESFWFLVKN